MKNIKVNCGNIEISNRNKICIIAGPCQLESEQQAKDSAKDYLLTAERRAHSAQNALEETRTMLEQADRTRKQSEQDLCDTNEQLADVSCQNQGLNSSKRKLESDLADLKVNA